MAKKVVPWGNVLRKRDARSVAIDCQQHVSNQVQAKELTVVHTQVFLNPLGEVVLELTHFVDFEPRSIDCIEVVAGRISACRHVSQHGTDVMGPLCN